jgi:ABC-type enterochelin transport system substrate-binding protein
MKIGAAMHDFMQKQIEASERLYNMMMADHKQRFEKIAEVYALSESLQKKINERDEEIQKLKQQLLAYESLERM